MTQALLLAVLLTPIYDPPPQVPTIGEEDLQKGIRQVNTGDFESAVLSLDAVIVKLSLEGAARAKELAQAYLYKGIALVGLMQEEAAKASFRQALVHEPQLRVVKGESPDRVVRVFESARRGTTKSVMKRPSGATKKTGMGAAAIVGIVGGVALAGGAAVVAATGSAPSPLPAPAVTPSSVTFTFSQERNCGSGLLSLTQNASLMVQVSINPPLRCITGFCVGTGTLGSNCRNTNRTLANGEGLTIPGLTSGDYQLWFCDCESDPDRRSPMTVTVTVSVN